MYFLGQNWLHAIAILIWNVIDGRKQKYILCLQVSSKTFFNIGTTALEDQGPLIIEDSWSHSDKPHSVGLLWTSERPDAETSTWQQSQQTNVHAPGRIRTHNPSKREAADPRFKTRGHWDRPNKTLRQLDLLYLTHDPEGQTRHFFLTKLGLILTFFNHHQFS
jgi:hypothetical protein